MEEQTLQQEEMQQQQNQQQEDSQANENQSQEDVLSALQKELEEAKARIAELEDVKLRQMAEFDNYRRRTQKEKLELMETAGEKIFTEMLALVDDFERAAKHGDLTDGMQLIYQKFLSFLDEHKVKAIDTEDVAFSEDFAEAIATFAAGEEKKGKIIDCTQKGYKLGEKVIRFAKVVVGE